MMTPRAITTFRDRLLGMTQRRWTDPERVDELNWLRARDATGIPRSEIARQYTATFGIPLSGSRVIQLLGKRPPKHPAASRQTVRITVVLDADEAAVVRELAAAWGYVSRAGSRAGSGHIDDLLSALATGEVKLCAGSRRKRPQ